MSQSGVAAPRRYRSATAWFASLQLVFVSTSRILKGLHARRNLGPDAPYSVCSRFGTPPSIWSHASSGKWITMASPREASMPHTSDRLDGGVHYLHFGSSTADGPEEVQASVSDTCSLTFDPRRLMYQSWPVISTAWQSRFATAA